MTEVNYRERLATMMWELLDIAARDGDSWKRGLRAFWIAIDDEGKLLDLAVLEAVTVAAENDVARINRTMRSYYAIGSTTSKWKRLFRVVAGVGLAAALLIFVGMIILVSVFMA